MQVPISHSCIVRMDFNMVANQSMGADKLDYKGLSAALVKVKMDKEKKHIVNFPEWKEALKSALVTFGL